MCLYSACSPGSFRSTVASSKAAQIYWIIYALLYASGMDTVLSPWVSVYLQKVSLNTQSRSALLCNYDHDHWCHLVISTCLMYSTVQYGVGGSSCVRIEVSSAKAMVSFAFGVPLRCYDPAKLRPWSCIIKLQYHTGTQTRYHEGLNYSMQHHKTTT